MQTTILSLFLSRLTVQPRSLYPVHGYVLTGHLLLFQALAGLRLEQYAYKALGVV